MTGRKHNVIGNGLKARSLRHLAFLLKNEIIHTIRYRAN